MILLLDNYDSFTHNLAHTIKKITEKPFDIIRNDQMSVADVAKYDTIILSPGPGIPDEAGILKSVIKEYYQTKNILGVCLGCQAIGEVFGAHLSNLDTVYHGVATDMSILDLDEILFQGLDVNFPAGRYHSWVIDRDSIPRETLMVTCEEEHGQVMGLRHRDYNVRGVQFHPESILSPDGETIIENFLRYSGEC